MHRGTKCAGVLSVLGNWVCKSLYQVCKGTGAPGVEGYWLPKDCLWVGGPGMWEKL